MTCLAVLFACLMAARYERHQVVKDIFDDYVKEVNQLLSCGIVTMRYL